MYSKYYLRLYEITTKVACWLGSLNLVYDSKSRKCSVNKKSSVWFRFNLIFVSALMCSWSLLLFRSWFFQPRDVGRLALSYTLLLCGIGGLGMASLFLFQEKSFALAITHIVHYAKEYEGKFNVKPALVLGHLKYQNIVPWFQKSGLENLSSQSIVGLD